MKSILLALIFSFTFLNFAPHDGDKAEWITPLEHDFGDLEQDKPATVSFKFKNISDEPLTIESVRPSCGCTAPEWDETPIEPGEKGKIKIKYDSKKAGYFRKKVKVYFHQQKEGVKLWIEGFVEQVPD